MRCCSIEKLKDFIFFKNHKKKAVISLVYNNNNNNSTTLRSGIPIENYYFNYPKYETNPYEYYMPWALRFFWYEINTLTFYFLILKHFFARDANLIPPPFFC